MAFMHKMVSLEQWGVFEIKPPVGTAANRDGILLYCPQTARLCKVVGGESGHVSPDEYAELVEKLRQGEQLAFPDLPETPDDFSKITLILNNRCNFSCSYCYSAPNRSSATLSCRDIDSIITWFVNTRGSCSSRLGFFISGGGEPLVSRKELYFALTRIKELCDSHDVRYDVVLMTNGSLIDDEFTSVAKNCHVHTSVSFEITEKSQNAGRGHYERVDAGIRRLIGAQCDLSLSSTITLKTVDDMPAMAAKIMSDYPSIRNWSCAPVVAPELSVADMESLYTRFTDCFFRCSDDLKTGKTRIGFTFYWKLTGIRKRFCPGKVCFSYDRGISICPFATSSRDAAYFYGHLDEAGRPVFDRDRFRGLMNENANRCASPMCSACFLKCHCAGLCFSRHRLMSAEQRDCICRFYRHFAAEYFWRQYESAGGGA